MADTRAILTECVYPPIPPLQFDWHAWRDGQEEYGPFGWGHSEQAAIRDLLEQEEADNV